MAMGSLATLLLVVAVAVIGTEALTRSKLSYCRNRKPSECCRDGRDDECTVKIRDTVCYCDDFCLDGNDRANDDCCPDFREVCLGEEGPDELNPTIYLENKNPTIASVCILKGKSLQDGTYTFNCNKCTCQDGRLDCETDKCLVDEDLIAKVSNNQQAYSWKPNNYSMFWGTKMTQGLVMRTGTLLSDDKTRAMHPILLYPKPELIPRTFDARVKWPGLISGVRDQGWCGASWIFSTLGVAQDRERIMARGGSAEMSPQQMLSCTPSESTCLGGYVDHAWMYIRRMGVVDEDCYPYVSGAYGEVPTCQRSARFSTCKVHKTEPAYRISNKAEDIKWEIMTNGPVQATMTVHRDLFVYRQGVYRCPGNNPHETRLHSVRILGWGEDATHSYPPTKYWLVANSWGTDWGENGLFKIQQGSCGIESFILAVRSKYDHWRKTPQFDFQRY